MHPAPQLTQTGFHRQRRLREFARRVANLQALNESGKLDEETTLLLIRKQWNELQQLQRVRAPRRISRPGG